MQIQSAKKKGRDLENFVVDRLVASGLDPRASRNPGSGSGRRKGDVWNALDLTIECKNTVAYPGQSVFRQVMREALGIMREVIVWHPPRVPLSGSHVIIGWEHFEDLMVKTRQPRSENPDRALRQKAERLILYAKEFIDTLEEDDKYNTYKGRRLIQHAKDLIKELK